MFTRWRRHLSLSIILSFNCVHLDFFYLPWKHLVLATVGEMILKKLNCDLVWQFLDCQVYHTVLITLINTAYK